MQYSPISNLAPHIQRSSDWICWSEAFGMYSGATQPELGNYASLMCSWAKQKKNMRKRKNVSQHARPSSKVIKPRATSQLSSQLLSSSLHTVYHLAASVISHYL